MFDRIIITAGGKYIDIDAYASIFAYKKLLNSLGQNAFAISTAIPNKSVAPIIKELGFNLDNNYELLPNDKFIILDVSNPDMFDKIVNFDNIIEIIDHHTGYEEYWKSKVENTIEFIGSICTIIYEKIKENNKIEILDLSLCKLLIAGILDNTLNLKSNITTDRDIKAYNELLQIGKINKEWYIDYFNSCYKDIEKDLEISIEDDIKIEYINDFLPQIFGQILILNNEIIFENIDKIKNVFAKYNKSWILNVICLNDGKSYLLVSDENTRIKTEQIFRIKGTDSLIILDKFMLRKEIMKLARTFENKND